MNTVALSGNLTHDLELGNTPSGKSVANFSIAVQRPYSTKETDYFDAVAWEKKAEFICQNFKKGNRIELNGYLQTRTYEDKNGVKRKAVELVVQDVGFAGMNLSEANAATASQNSGYPSHGYYPQQAPMQQQASGYYPPQPMQQPNAPAGYYPNQPMPVQNAPAPVPAKRAQAARQPAPGAPMPTVADFTASVQYPNGVNGVGYWEEVG